MMRVGFVVGCGSIVFFLVGCQSPCPSDEVRVKRSGGGSVCVPTGNDDDADSVAEGNVGRSSPYESVTLPGTQTTQPPPPSNPGASSGGCRTEDAGDLTVHVVAKGGLSPALVSSVTPDGHYVLVQATWFAGDAGPPPLLGLRAGLAVQGAVWVLGTRGDTDGSLGAAEGVTLSVIADTATHVCSASAANGGVVSSLLPPAGATTRAAAAWDATLSTSTLVLTTPKGADIELVFVPE